MYVFFIFMNIRGGVVILGVLVVIFDVLVNFMVYDYVI